jgi:chromosome segregation ATPase
MRVPDAHKVAYSEAQGIGDFFKRVIWNQLPRRFRAVMHEVAALNVKVLALEEEIQALERKIGETKAEIEGLELKFEELDADDRERKNLQAKVQEIDAKVQELENQRLIAIPTVGNIMDQQALQRRLAAFEDVLPEITEKLVKFEELLRRIDEKVA